MPELRCKRCSQRYRVPFGEERPCPACGLANAPGPAPPPKPKLGHGLDALGSMFILIGLGLAGWQFFSDCSFFCLAEAFGGLGGILFILIGAVLIIFPRVRRGSL